MDMIRTDQEEHYRRLKDWYASMPPLPEPKKSRPSRIEVFIFALIIGVISGRFWAFKIFGG